MGRLAEYKTEGDTTSLGVALCSIDLIVDEKVVGVARSVFGIV